MTGAGDAPVFRFDALDSTSEEARRRAEAGEAGPFWIAAARQTRGRGRQGRPWIEAEGNLYATLLIRPEMSAATASLASFAACLAVAELFERAGAAPALKWPNDVLLNGGKASGVLLEASGRQGVIDWLSIGIGVNLASSPAGDPSAAHPPTNLLAETGRRLPADEALAILARALDARLKSLAQDGFAALRRDWLARAVRLGERIEARLPAETIAGVFEDMDETGALVLRTPSGRRVIHAADIYFR